MAVHVVNETLPGVTIIILIIKYGMIYHAPIKYISNISKSE